jgi:hypothetical protein
MLLVVGSWIACGSTGRRIETDAGAPSAEDAAADSLYINPGCPVLLSPGCPGNMADAAGCQTTFSCYQLPSECASNLTCDCVACSTETCAACNVVGSGQYTNNTGGGATCRYAEQRFIVQCINQ